MTQSLYVVGGAGTGKSTFTGQVMAGVEFGPHVNIHTADNFKGKPVTMKGHWLGDGGLYIGRMRDSFPGTDGLRRDSSPAGLEWLVTADLPPYIVAEGATYGTRRFLATLHEMTDLLVLHLYADEFVVDLRLQERGSTQKETFVRGTATRARNLAKDMGEYGVQVVEFDSADVLAWRQAVELASFHLHDHENPC